jgi:hypothetical protein
MPTYFGDGWLLPLGLLALIGLGFFAWTRRGARREPDHAAIDAQEQVRRLTAEIDAAADRAVSRVNTAMNELRTAVRAARETKPGPEVRPVAAKPDVGEPAAAPRRAVETFENPRFRRVYELADAGRTPIDIAEATGMMLGEVEMLLEMRRP